MSRSRGEAIGIEANLLGLCGYAGHRFQRFIVIEKTPPTTRLSSASPYPLDTKSHKIDYIIEVREGSPGLQFIIETPKISLESEYIDYISLNRDGLYDAYDALTDDKLDEEFAKAQKEMSDRVDDSCRRIGTDILAHWIEKDAWTPAEGLCLWLELDPRFGNELIAWGERDKRLAKAALEVSRRWDLLARALAVAELHAPLKPRLFLHWARNKRPINEYLNDFLDKNLLVEFATEREKSLSVINIELHKDIERLSNSIDELRQPHYKLAVKLFGAVCAGMYGHKIGSRNASTKIITEIVGMFINDCPKSERQIREYIQKSIKELDKGDVEKLASIYDEKAQRIGTPIPLDRNFPSRS